jgi:hypothetical protein
LSVEALYTRPNLFARMENKCAPHWHLMINQPIIKARHPAKESPTSNGAYNQLVFRLSGLKIQE